MSAGDAVLWALSAFLLSWSALLWVFAVRFWTETGPDSSAVYGSHTTDPEYIESTEPSAEAPVILEWHWPLPDREVQQGSPSLHWTGTSLSL